MNGCLNLHIFAFWREFWRETFRTFQCYYSWRRVLARFFKIPDISDILRSRDDVDVMLLKNCRRTQLMTLLLSASLIYIQLSYLASSYINNYKPNKSTIVKYKILKNLRKKQDIIITQPDKGNGVVILNRKDQYNMMHGACDVSTFKILDKDVTISREAKLQRYLLQLKKKGFFF